ncbi:CBS domain-containing protein [Inmirania thermothiophila]|uniref:CBS domain protein n=1 Tax=Inmirania thermothiophila TaxID=1750597 RepID=A0A3N1YAB4_9GAMM|nr:CBS domain-containing protein [Inmirania thermothiophila]ROR34337.1 CBS domain protein [Inmirania thermothiophila]
MLVQDAMTRAVRTVTPETRLYEVAALMCINRIKGLPVVEDGDRIVGIIAERDVLHRMFPRLDELMAEQGPISFEEMESQYREVVNLEVRDVMSTRVITVPPDYPLLKATSVMVSHRFRRIPVAVDGRLCGMLSIGDVHKALFLKHMRLS